MINRNEYLVVGRSNSTTKTGSPFCILKLKNTEEEISISVWDVLPDDQPVFGQLVSFIDIKDNAGKKSARKMDMVPGSKPSEGHPLYGLLPHPIKRELWDKCIDKLVSYCNDKQLTEAIKEYANTLFKPYSQYPAATSVHHAFPGGLLNHTYQMLHMLEGLYPCLPYPVKIERCILAILFHDYGKVYEYNKEGDPQVMKHLLGHVYISANRLQKTLEEKNISNDEVSKIVHIVLAHHGQLDYGSPVVPCTQEAVIVHYLDDLSAKVDIIESSPAGERNFALGTTIVKD